MPAPRIRSIEFLSEAADLEPGADNADIQVKLEDGTFSSFVVATPDQPARWMANDAAEFSFGSPTLFVRRLDKASVREAVEAMARDIGGYWLRHYNSLGDLASIRRTLRLRFGGRREDA